MTLSYRDIGAVLTIFKTFNINFANTPRVLMATCYMESSLRNIIPLASLLLYNYVTQYVYAFPFPFGKICTSATAFIKSTAFTVIQYDRNLTLSYMQSSLYLVLIDLCCLKVYMNNEINVLVINFLEIVKKHV